VCIAWKREMFRSLSANNHQFWFWIDAHKRPFQCNGLWIKLLCKFGIKMTHNLTISEIFMGRGFYFFFTCLSHFLQLLALVDSLFLTFSCLISCLIHSSFDSFSPSNFKNSVVFDKLLNLRKLVDPGSCLIGTKHKLFLIPPFTLSGHYERWQTDKLVRDF